MALNGDLFFTDHSNHSIRKIDLSDNSVTTISGIPGSTGYVDGAGASSKFYYPWSLTTDGECLYLMDNGNDSIRKVDPLTGETSTLVGEPGMVADGEGTVSPNTLGDAIGLVWTPSGFFYSAGLNIKWIH